jgi:hypothetical protein
MDRGIAVESMTGDGYYPVPGFLAAPLVPLLLLYSRPNPSSEAPLSTADLRLASTHTSLSWTGGILAPTLMLRRA